MHPPLTDCWYLTGPTAAGKTAVGVALAQRIGAEIISLDSMAVYCGMDIGTAKPEPAAVAAIPHHLLNLVEPDQDFSIADYLAAAHATAAQIRSRGRQVLFVGGTPLYLKALLCGMEQGPQPDWESRERLLAEARDTGPEALHRRLAAVDPEAAARLHPRDARRIVRALEVYERTGRPISSQQQHFHAPLEPDPTSRVIALDWPRAVLHARINARVDAMFSAGLVEEVRALLVRFGSLGRTASQAAGYREVADYLAGRIGLPAAVEQTQARTRQLARRQLTWLRSLQPCEWIVVEEPLDPEQIASRIVSR